MKQFLLFAISMIAIFGAISLKAAETSSRDVENRISDQPIYRNVYGELFGASDFIGVNYDQRFERDSKWGFRAGLGYGFKSESGFYGANGHNTVILPVGINGLFGKNRHYFEAGLGVTPMIEFHKDYTYLQPDGSVDMDHPTSSSTDSNFALKVFMDLGYRYQRSNGFLFRAGVTPYLFTAFPFGVFRVMPYIGLGYTFK